MKTLKIRIENVEKSENGYVYGEGILIEDGYAQIKKWDKIRFEIEPKPKSAEYVENDIQEE